MARTAMAIGRLVDTPQKTKHIMVHTRPMRIVGLRPMLSDAQPQGTAVTLWHIEKTAPVMPAHWATSSFSTPKPWIISGRYGNTEVKARGSANLTTAGPVIIS